jgi:hypothetical protein
MFDRFYKERKEADLLSKKSFAELNQEQARNMSTLEKRKNHQEPEHRSSKEVK